MNPIERKTGSRANTVRAVTVSVGLALVACAAQPPEPAAAPPQPPPPPPAAPEPSPPPVGTKLEAAIEGGAIVVRSSQAAARVEIRFADGVVVSGSTDASGTTSVAPAEGVLFDNAESPFVTVAVGNESVQLDVRPLLTAAKGTSPDAWKAHEAEVAAQRKAADAAVHFDGAIYHELGADLVDTCVPSGGEICFDGLDNDCDGRYDDTNCGYASGAMQWTLIWKGRDDLNLRVVGPDGVAVSHDQPIAEKSGLVLDRHCSGTASGAYDCPTGNVENIVLNQAPMTGTYMVYAEVQHSHATEPIHARIAGRIGSRTWYASVSLPPWEGATYLAAYSVGGDQDEDLVTDAYDACPKVQGCYFEDPKHRGCPDGDRDGVPDSIDACPTQTGVDQKDPKKHGCPIRFGGASVTNLGVAITQRIEFEFGKAELTERSKKVLIDVAAAIKAQPESVKQLSIDGHTDAVGDELRNMGLSTLRARSVFLELERLGVPKEKLITRGYGETRPIAENDTKAGRKKNRRVEFLITDPKPRDPECLF